MISGQPNIWLPTCARQQKRWHDCVFEWRFVSLYWIGKCGFLHESCACNYGIGLVRWRSSQINLFNQNVISFAQCPKASQTKFIAASRRRTHRGQDVKRHQARQLGHRTKHNVEAVFVMQACPLRYSKRNCLATCTWMQFVCRKSWTTNVQFHHPLWSHTSVLMLDFEIAWRP